MEEIKLNMENLTKEEREQLLKLVEKANKKEPRVWKPESREVYYYFSSEGYTEQASWYDCQGDEDSYAIGNCFKTKKEVEFEVEKLRVITELKRFAKEHNDPAMRPCWLLRYDNVCSFSSVIGVGTYNYGAAIIPAFTSESIAMKAVDVIGKDRLKKYYFGVKD